MFVEGSEPAGGEMGVLHGLPMTHKDTHRTRGMRTTQGSVIFRDQVPSQDDLVIERLKPLLEDPAVLKVAQNAKYDMAVLSRYGIKVGPIDLTVPAGGSSPARAIDARICMPPDSSRG